MSFKLKEIEECINIIPNMDVKNIGKLIYSYCKYNIIDNFEINYILINIEKFTFSDNEYVNYNGKDIMYCKINNNYYLLHGYKSLINIRNGSLYSSNLSEQLNYIELYPDYFIFLSNNEGINTEIDYDIYKIHTQFNTKQQFLSVLKQHLETYKNLLCNGFIPENSSNTNERLNSIDIIYNNIEHLIWSFNNSNLNDKNNIKQSGLKLSKIIDNILNLI
jgi:hypothetical protein